MSEKPIDPRVRIGHVHLKVADLDRAVHFYHDILGLELRGEYDPASGRNSAAVKAGNQAIDIFYRSDFTEADKDKPVGVDHLCLIIEDIGDIDGLMDYLREEGVEIMWGPVSRHGSTSVYVYDPDGIHVELRMNTPAGVPETPRF